MADEYKNKVLPEAGNVVNGDRLEKYGHAQTNFTNIALGWQVIFGCQISPRQVALANIWQKICRDVNMAIFDNPVDIAGYAALMDEVSSDKVNQLYEPYSDRFRAEAASDIQAFVNKVFPEA